MKHLGILVISFVLLWACKEKKSSTVEHIKLKAEMIEVKETLNPQDVLCTGNYLVVRNDLEEGVFSVYTLPDLQHAFSWGRIGKGPGEYQAPCMTTSEQDRILVADYVAFSLTENDLKNNFEPFATYALTRDIPLFNDIHLINDSSFCFPIREKGKIFIDERKLKTGEAIDKVELPSDFPDADGVLAVSGNKWVYAYCFQNKLWIRNQETKEEKQIGTGEKDPRGEVFYYSQVKATPRFIYALFQGYTEEEISPDTLDKHSRILVYDWTGKLVKEIELDRIVSLIAISSDEKNLYAFSPFDPEHLLRYTFNEGSL